MKFITELGLAKFSTVCILLIILIFVAGFWFIVLPVSDRGAEETQFSIKKGEGSRDIALNLEKAGLIRWSFPFRLYILAVGVTGKLQAGEYFLSPSMNVPEIAEKLVKGETIKITVTIPEGFTVKQVEERLGLELPGDNLEGFLFPDTYQFSLNVSGEEVVKRMRDNFEKKLAPYRDEVSGAGMTLFEIVTMASLIEKEVKTPEDKKLVSGILWKRLAANIPLQVDATLAYILEVEGWTFGEMRREISLGKDVDSPYNTYKYPGLPVDPICNPGLESILAALYPEESNYWYYLSTEGGETIFSKTLEEHNIAKSEHFK